MSSPRARKATNKRKRGFKAGDPVADGLTSVEIVHEALLQVSVFVSIANELSQDDRWTGRIIVLLQSVTAPLKTALINIEQAIDSIIQRRRLESRR